VQWGSTLRVMGHSGFVLQGGDKGIFTANPITRVLPLQWRQATSVTKGHRGRRM